MEKKEVEQEGLLKILESKATEEGGKGWMDYLF